MAWLALPQAVPAQPVVQRVATASDAWLNLTNDGVLGNDFTSRTPSLEYPIGTGYEHLTHGGLWVGAHAIDALGSFTGVVTGGMDQFLGQAPSTLSEWTPVSSSFWVRSNLVNSGFYNPAALSPDESIVFYDDRAPKTTQGNPEPHRPIGIRVRQVSHSWDSPGYRDFVVVRFILTNQTVLPVNDLWVGLYTELASGPKASYSSWPPSGGWFSKKLLEWDPAWRMLREIGRAHV